LQVPLDSPNIPHINKNITFDIKTLPKSKVSLSEIDKMEVCSEVTHYIQEEFSSHLQLYVDGSKDPESGIVGAIGNYHFQEHF
jgi:hypothetical protein